MHEQCITNIQMRLLQDQQHNQGCGNSESVRIGSSLPLYSHWAQFCSVLWTPVAAGSGYHSQASFKIRKTDWFEIIIGVCLQSKGAKYSRASFTKNKSYTRNMVVRKTLIVGQKHSYPTFNSWCIRRLNDMNLIPKQIHKLKQKGCIVQQGQK